MPLQPQSVRENGGVSNKDEKAFAILEMPGKLKNSLHLRQAI
jgi:hypothetical protein